MTTGRHRNLPDHSRCTAMTKRSGTRCTQPAVTGSTVCRMHGAGAPQVRRAAARRVVMARAERAVLALDPDARSGNWIDALERVLARLEGMEEHIRSELEALEVARIRQHGAEGGEAIHALVQAYGQILDRLGTTAHRMGQLDLEAVRVRISARQQEAVADALLAGIDAAGLSPADAERVRDSVASALDQLHNEGRAW